MVIVNIEASAGSKDYTAHVLKELGRVWAAAWWPQPLKRRAGSVTSLTRTDGILRIPAESDGVEEDSEVTA